MRTTMLPVYNYENERELLFWPLVAQYEDVIPRVFKKYKFIPRSEYEDYKQEILIGAWKLFYKYMAERDQYSFGQWLFTTARSIVWTYRMRHLKIGKRDISRFYHDRIIYKDNMDNLEIQDNFYDDSIPVMLNQILQQLSREELRIVTIYLSETDMQALSLSEGKAAHYYSHRFRSIRMKMQDIARRYFPDRCIIIKHQPQKSRGTGADNIKSKAVMQIDFNGNIIHVWPSAMEAERSGQYKAKTIQRAAAGHIGSYAGFLWIYQGASEDYIKERVLRVKKSGGKKTEGRLIEQLTMEGKVITTWTSIKEAAKDGFQAGLIWKVANGLRPHHKGYKWRYADNHENN